VGPLSQQTTGSKSSFWKAASPTWFVWYSISRVLYEAAIEFSDALFDTSAATAVVMNSIVRGPRAEPEVMRFVRPFEFMIRPRGDRRGPPRGQSRGSDHLKTETRDGGHVTDWLSAPFCALVG
jgi:hypothetical protein